MLKGSNSEWKSNYIYIYIYGLQFYMYGEKYSPSMFGVFHNSPPYLWNQLVSASMKNEQIPPTHYFFSSIQWNHNTHRHAFLSPGMLFLVFVSYFHLSCYNVRVDSLCCSRRSLLKWIPNKMVSSYLKTHWCDCPVWHHCRNLNVNSVNLWLDAMYFRIKKEKNISRFKRLNLNVML